MKQKPLVSIIMSSYNYSLYIGEAINSAVSQTYINWELIIIDDGSEDNSIEVIMKFTSKYPDKIFLYTHPENTNLNIKATYSLGISKAKGEYIAFLESDDRWRRDCLERKIDIFLKNKNLSLVYSNINLIGEKEAITPKYLDYINYCRYVGLLFRGKPFIPLKLLWLRNPVVSFSNIVFPADLLKYISFKKDFEIWSDWRILMQLALVGKFFYIPEILVDWRIHNRSANSKFMSKNDQYIAGSMFKIDLLNMAKDFCYETQNLELMKQILESTISVRAHLFRFIHDFGFFLYSPISVIRTIYRNFFSKLN